MRPSKIGTVFLVTILALAGIGISYSGLSDIIHVYGTVQTGTVDLVIEDYSGTEVWKVWNDDGLPSGYEEEFFIWEGYASDPEVPLDENYVKSQTGADHAEYEASAWAEDGTTHDTTTYDVDMVWDNIFPCVEFTADVILHYDGSIPARLKWPTLVWHEGENIFSPYIDMKAYKYTKIGEEWQKGEQITSWPYQMHHCYYIGFEVTIHLLQVPTLEGQHGEFSFDLEIIQWTDDCDDGTTPDKSVVIPGSDHDPRMKVYGPFPSGWDSYLKTHIYNIGDEGWKNDDDIPYNVWNGYWLGWCVDEDHTVNTNHEYDIEFYSSYDPGMPDECKDDDWPYVNWIINHKGSATPQQIQNAIWYFINGGWAPYGDPTHPQYDQVVQDLIDDAIGNPEGLNYKPDTGDWLAVICWIDACHQITFIEVDP